MKVISPVRALAWLFAALSYSTLTLAQTAPAKPVAKPAAPAPASATTPAAKPADGKTSGIGGGSGGGGILTRDELRACLKQELTMRTRLSEHAASRVPLDQEKLALTADQQALRTDRAGIDELKMQSEALAGKLKVFSLRVTTWNEQVEEFNRSSRASDPNRERRQAALNTERELIAKERTELEAERMSLLASNEIQVKAFNVKAQALDARVGAWNERNAAWNDAGPKLETEREQWVSACSNRRYREEDEIAIRAGK